MSTYEQCCDTGLNPAHHPHRHAAQTITNSPVWCCSEALDCFLELCAAAVVAAAETCHCGGSVSPSSDSRAALRPVLMIIRHTWTEETIKHAAVSEQTLCSLRSSLINIKDVQVFVLHQCFSFLFFMYVRNLNGWLVQVKLLQCFFRYYFHLQCGFNCSMTSLVSVSFSSQCLLTTIWIKLTLFWLFPAAQISELRCFALCDLCVLGPFSLALVAAGVSDTATAVGSEWVDGYGVTETWTLSWNQAAVSHCNCVTDHITVVTAELSCLMGVCCYLRGYRSVWPHSHQKLRYWSQRT